MTRRKVLPDLLKGVAVVLMIQVHLTELFANTEFYQSAAGKISLFLGGFPAAPVFMAVMGWFAFAARPLKKELIRAVRLIGLGLVLNAALNFNLFMRIMAGEMQVDALAYLFGADILFLAGLSLAAGSLLKRLVKYRWWGLLLAAALTAALSPVLSSGTPADGAWRYIRPLLADNYAWWSYFPLFPWMAYTLAGMAAAALAQQERGLWLFARSRACKITAVAIFLAGLWFGWNVSTNLQAYYHHNILFFAWAMSAIISWAVLWKALSRLIPELSSLTWVGRHVTKIYVIQWIIIGNLGTWLYRSQSGPALVIWCMLVMLITFTLVYVYEKLTKREEELI